MITENNWIQINLRDRLTNPYIDFKVILTPFNFDEVSFEEACLKTAKDIQEKYPRIYLAFSGGLDSRYVFKFLVENNIKFTPYSVYVKGEITNEKEIVQGFELCKKYNIKPEIITITDKEFIKSYIDRIYTPIRGYGLYSSPKFLIAEKAIKDNAVLIFAESIIDDHEGFLVSEFDFYSDIVDPNIGIPFFLYSPDTSNAILKASIENNLIGEQLKNKLYNDYTKKLSIEFLSPTSQAIKRYYVSKLVNEKLYRQKFGTAKEMYDFFTPWRNNGNKVSS